ncbi:MAG TPA: sugar nucleotide-binding protein [Bryobacteraceae bacterium]|nr:sugar nucleotide-binding protein [Bryobacteraceae bacterium]
MCELSGLPVFITGLSGMLGASLASCCVHAGMGVSGVSYRSKLGIPGVSEDTADITAADYQPALIEAASGLIIHCAAATDVDWCERNEAAAFRLNVEVSGRLAAAAAKSGWRFVYISTDSVFDGCHGDRCESDVPNPVHVIP